MLGLTYIRKDIFHMTLSWLANVVKVSRQGVTDWESSRSNLSEERLNILEKIFGVSKQWYDKEINEIDKLKIDNEVLNNIIFTTKYNNIEIYENVDIRNIHFEKTTADLDRFLKIKDIKKRNDCVLKQIAENEKNIHLLEINSQISNNGNYFINSSTLFDLYMNCLTTFNNIISQIKDEDENIQDIKFAELKKYLLGYKIKNE